MEIGNIVAAAARVDGENVLVEARSDRALQAALDMVRPLNWHGTGAGQDLLAAAQEEGLPLAWVPPAAVIRRLRSAGSAQARETVIVSSRSEIIDACLKMLDECTAPELAECSELVRRSVKAVRDGHHEAGMALAVSVVESQADWAIKPRVRAFDDKVDRDRWDEFWKKKRIGRARQVDMVKTLADQVEPWEFVHQVLIAPIPTFFVNFTAGDEVPASANRHVVAHQPSLAHMNPANALKSIMLATGIVRSQQEWLLELGGE